MEYVLAATSLPYWPPTREAGGEVSFVGRTGTGNANHTVDRHSVLACEGLREQTKDTDRQSK